MDILGSILNSMDGPPAANEKQKELLKKQKEEAEKLKNREKAELLRFRKFVEERIGRFLKDEQRRDLPFQPLDKFYRNVIHDVAEVAGLVAMSFGQDGIDRYTVIYKKETMPSEDEIEARRNGEVWSPQIAKEYARKREAKVMEEAASAEEVGREVVPTTNYKDKYVHLIGREAALEAARKTESNVSYGFVPSENKKDIRSIEQTMADIQAKKRLKLSQSDNAQPSSSAD